MQVKPTSQVKQAWDHHVLQLANLTHDRAAHVSALASTIISPEQQDHLLSEFQSLGTKMITIEGALEFAPRLATLREVELQLAKEKDKINVLEAERPLGDDASRNLEAEIRTAREEASIWEKAIKIIVSHYGD